MDCRTSSEIMIKGLDGPLAEPEEKRLQQHLETCDACRREVKEWEEIIHALAHLPVPVPSAGFEAGVMAAVDLSRYQAHRLARQPQTRRFLAGLGLLGTLGLLMLEMGSLLQVYAMGRLERTTAFQALSGVFQRFVRQGDLNIFIAQNGVLDRIFRPDAVSSWWLLVGTLNLVMLLILIKISLDRLMTGGKGEVQ